jgi:NADPH:quinone reductase-like Zn-dependent oxidoreductase
MKAIFLVKTGEPEKAFEYRDTAVPKIAAGEVLIKVEGFGLNFADIVAREGMYKDAPPRPCVLGYEVVGRIAESNNMNFAVGDRVVALTKFGGYAEYAVTDARATIKIADSISIPIATALATQYCTAYYAAAVAGNLREGERVIIHAASGGVGNALLQYAKYKGCDIIATTSSPSKVELLKNAGARHVINLGKENFRESVEKIYGSETDAIFDSLGGKYVRQGISLLAPGGRIICFGASQMTGVNMFKRISAALQFGFYHPAQFLMHSKSLIGVNMLHIAEKRPEIIQYCLGEVLTLFNNHIFNPPEGKLFKASEIASAHRYLQEKKAFGKVALAW